MPLQLCHRFRTRLMGLSVTSLSLALLSGCGSLGTESSAAVALVRFVEMSPGSPDVDFSIGGTGAAYGLGFESFTSYLPVNPGPASIRVSRSSHNAPLATAEAVLQGGQQYTVVLSQGLADLRQVVLTDQRLPAAAGQVDLRLVNVVAGPPGVTFHIAPERGGETPESTVTLKAGAASPYLHLVAGRSYQISATAPGAGVASVWNTLTLRAESGAVRTVVFGGVAERASHPHLVSFLLSDVDPT